MSLTRDDLVRQIDALVVSQRALCLWFLRPDYFPRSDLERWRVLSDIQRHGDLQAYRQAALLKQWLSQTFSATSANC